MTETMICPGCGRGIFVDTNEMADDTIYEADEHGEVHTAGRCNAARHEKEAAWRERGKVTPAQDLVDVMAEREEAKGQLAMRLRDFDSLVDAKQVIVAQRDEARAEVERLRPLAEAGRVCYCCRQGCGPGCECNERETCAACEVEDASGSTHGRRHTCYQRDDLAAREAMEGGE